MGQSILLIYVNMPPAFFKILLIKSQQPTFESFLGKLHLYKIKVRFFFNASSVENYQISSLQQDSHWHSNLYFSIIATFLPSLEAWIAARRPDGPLPIQIRSNSEVIINFIKNNWPHFFQVKIKKILVKHYDLYRIKNEKELNNLGIQENLKKQITLVEWPEIIKKLKIKNSISLIFKYNESYTERYLTIISKNKKIINEFK